MLPTNKNSSKKLSSSSTLLEQFILPSNSTDEDDDDFELDLNNNVMLITNNNNNSEIITSNDDNNNNSEREISSPISPTTTSSAFQPISSSYHYVNFDLDFNKIQTSSSTITPTSSSSKLNQRHSSFHRDEKTQNNKPSRIKNKRQDSFITDDNNNENNLQNDEGISFSKQLLKTNNNNNKNNQPSINSNIKVNNNGQNSNNSGSNNEQSFQLGVYISEQRKKINIFSKCCFFSFSGILILQLAIWGLISGLVLWMVVYTKPMTSYSPPPSNCKGKECLEYGIPVELKSSQSVLLTNILTDFDTFRVESLVIILKKIPFSLLAGRSIVNNNDTSTSLRLLKEQSVTNNNNGDVHIFFFRNDLPPLQFASSKIKEDTTSLSIDIESEQNSFILYEGYLNENSTIMVDFSTNQIEGNAGIAIIDATDSVFYLSSILKNITRKLTRNETDDDSIVFKEAATAMYGSVIDYIIPSYGYYLVVAYPFETKRMNGMLVDFDYYFEVNSTEYDTSNHSHSCILDVTNKTECYFPISAFSLGEHYLVIEAPHFQQIFKDTMNLNSPQRDLAMIYIDYDKCELCFLLIGVFLPSLTIFLINLFIWLIYICHRKRKLKEIERMGYLLA